MKFKVTKKASNNLLEDIYNRHSTRWPNGHDAEVAADIIEGILESGKFDLSEEEKNLLDKAYDILWQAAPHVQESIKQKSLKEELFSNINGERIPLSVAKRHFKKSLPVILDTIKEIEELDSSGWKKYKQNALRTGEGPITVSQEEYLNRFRKELARVKAVEKDLLDQARKKYGKEFLSLDDIPNNIDISLKEVKDVNLSNKSNSISGLLLDNKDKIDAATSQQELVKVCKDALAEKGGAKAQQFLAVLASKKGHPAALQYVYDFILAGEGMRSPDSQRKTKPAHMKEALEEDFSTEQDLIDAGFEQAGYRKQYDFYRKRIDGKGTWYAVDTKSGNVFPITWSQAVGYDPIDSAEGLSMKLGSMLLPH